MYNKTNPRLAISERAAHVEHMLEQGIQRLGKIPTAIWKLLVVLLLIIWLSYSLARLFWLALPEPVLAAPSIDLASSPTTQVQRVDVDIDALKKLSLFGKPSAPSVSAEQLAEQEAAKAASLSEAEAASVDTQLNLTLLGVIASSTDADGRAIIMSNGKQDIYAPGQELPVAKGVTLSRVLSDRAILNNNGRFESLWLYQGTENTTAPARQIVGAPNGLQSSRVWVDTNNSPPFTTTAELPAPTLEAEGQGPAENDQVTEMAKTLSDVVSMTIHREGGQVMGYKLSPGKNAEQFTALGFQPNDIVTAVNGMPLTDPSKTMEIYRNIRNATSASLEINRGGSVLNLEVVLP